MLFEHTIIQTNGRSKLLFFLLKPLDSKTFVAMLFEHTITSKKLTGLLNLPMEQSRV